MEQGGFRFQSRRALFTYRSHLSKKGVLKHFTELGAIEVITAHETGHEDTPYEHTHIYVDFGRPYNTRNARHFDCNDIHPHIKKVMSRKHMEHLWEYLSKEDHENDYLRERIGRSMAEGVWRHNTMQDALREVTELRDVVPTIQLYQQRPTEEVIVDAPEQWRPWQQKIIDLIESEPDDRSIVWIYDKKGGAGKSLLTRWLKANKKAEFVKYFSRTTDFMTLVDNQLARGWDGRCLIADLPRDAEQKNLYEPMESFKDGMIQTSKYVGSTRIIPHPHMIVMANFLPQWGKLTRDRWHTYSISEDFDLVARAQP